MLSSLPEDLKTLLNGSWPEIVPCYKDLAAHSLGGTGSLPQLFAAASTKFAFNAATLRTYVDLMERTIFELESH